MSEERLPRLRITRSQTTDFAHALDGAAHTGVAGTEDHFFALDASGRPKDSGFDADDFVRTLGKAGGQAIYGGTGAGETLTLDSTSHAAKGLVSINPGGAVRVGYHYMPVNSLSLNVYGSGDRQTYFDMFSADGAYAFRIMRNAGVNGASQLIHTGTGNFQIDAVDAATLQFLTADTERMRIDASGQVGMGASTLLGKLHVAQASPAGALPVVYLQQADIDRPVLHVRASAEAGQAARSLVTASDLGSVTLVGYVMVEVTDDGNQLTDGVKYLPIYEPAS